MNTRPAASQELRFLRFIAQHGPMSVGQVAETLGGELGLARSTVQTVLERLRTKGHLTRRRVSGVFTYASAASDERVTRSAVRRFVENALAGSVSPFVAYLAERQTLSDADVEELRRVVERLDSRKGRGR